MNHSVEALLHGKLFKRLYSKKIEGVRKENNLTKIDIEILFFLYHSGEHNTSKDICMEKRLNKGHISQSVEHLVQEKMLVYSFDKHDKRCIHFLLTEQANQICAKIDEIWDQMYNIIFDGISEEEKRTLRTIAEKMSENMTNSLNE